MSKSKFQILNFRDYTPHHLMVRGYTLVELLIAMTIMAVLGVMFFINTKNFSQDQALKKATTDLQSYLRLAQSNATASLLCNQVTTPAWFIEFFTDGKTVYLKCQGATTPQKSLILDPIVIDLISGPSINCNYGIPTSGTISVNYAILSGNVSFTDPNNYCSGNSLSIRLNNPANSATKTVTVYKGGKIDVQ